ncbi:MAG: multidrug effflux MFS transporter [Oceanospirillales bacterium]|nr:multidrug effflux MFS transporter [Oceanospirillales bacterium]
MFRRPPFALVILLLSFPQIVETIYSPSLPLIASAYRVTPEEAGQTLSLWFIAFALGVVFWGRLSDLAGRRPTLLAGLAIFVLGSGWAMTAGDFEQLMLARFISAFGAAVGSIITQTSLRDSYPAPDLARVFSVLGVALAVSPAIGMVLGQEISAYAGHKGMFAGLGLLAITLLCLSLVFWPETRPTEIAPALFISTLRNMLSDGEVWRNALLIAVFNLAIFGYYQLAPFLFERLETRWFEFGESGFVLAVASLLGAALNSLLLQKRISTRKLIKIGVMLLSFGACLLALLSTSQAFLIGMVFVSMAYAIAIPNILANALRNYTGQLGTAGAILSLLYYVLLGIGLVAAGVSQRLDLVLIFCAIVAALAFGIARSKCE